MALRNWYIGDPVPPFVARTTSINNFIFDTAAGRYIVLCFFGSASIEKNYQALNHMFKRRRFFDDLNATFMGVSVDPSDEARKRVGESLPGIRYFWDFDHKVSRLYGAIGDEEIIPGAPLEYRSFTLILDPTLRVLAYIPLKVLEEHNAMFDRVMDGLPAEPELHAGVKINAPVLVVPRILEPEFCTMLIKKYEENGGKDSGFMREVNGKTVGVMDGSFKRRKDFIVEAEDIRRAIVAKFTRRLFPEINKAFQYEVTRMERYLVACYDASTGGFFRAHRDNTTKGTAHRRFACTINLNAEEFDGGELNFPEFGPQTYRAPTGGAVIFSCSLLHEAKPVTKGKRYAFLPFLYDDAAAEIRRKNVEFVSNETINLNETAAYTNAGISPSSDAVASPQ